MKTVFLTIILCLTNLSLSSAQSYPCQRLCACRNDGYDGTNFQYELNYLSDDGITYRGFIGSWREPNLADALADCRAAAVRIQCKLTSVP
ncbi:MAG: hypothetical protein ACXVCY_06100 [Pseudobdellovibrionaceae bacterium]